MKTLGSAPGLARPIPPNSAGLAERKHIRGSGIEWWDAEKKRGSLSWLPLYLSVTVFFWAIIFRVNRSPSTVS
jgi:hypothetical protein